MNKYQQNYKIKIPKRDWGGFLANVLIGALLGILIVILLVI